MLSELPERYVCNNCAATKQGETCEDCTMHGCACPCQTKCSRCGLSLLSYLPVSNIRQGIGYHNSRDGERPAKTCKGRDTAIPAPAVSTGERETFESVFAKSYMGGMETGRNSLGEYTSPYTQSAWDAWKTAKIQAVEEIKQWID